MPKAIPDKVVTQLRSQVEVMLYRHLQLHPFDMTHDECLRLIAPSEHIEILKSVAQYADVSSHNDWVNLTVPYEIDGRDHPQVTMMMRTHEGVEPPLRPRAPVWRGFAPHHIQNKVINWMTHRLYHGRMASTSLYVLDTINNICDKGEQVRYLWPAVMHLFTSEQNEHAQRWRDKFGHYKGVKNTPGIEPALRKAMIETSTWLTQASLIADIPAQETGPVRIDLVRFDSFYFDGKVLLTRL